MIGYVNVIWLICVLWWYVIKEYITFDVAKYG